VPEPPDLHGAIAIEAVDWAPGGDEKVTISVRGRWRRRRPVLSGQPVLVVEAEGRRHRFPATPEPPSVGGAPPGGWQMTFSVPALLAPHLGGRAWLQLGVAVVPLPRALGPGQRSADEDTLVERRARTAELAEQRARTRVSEAEAVVAELAIRVEELERLLEQARGEPQRLRRMIAERDQQRRAAEQRAHVEHAMRLELEEALEAADRGEDEQLRLTAGELAAAESRVRELELELETASRRADEAEQLAVAARSFPVASPEPARALVAGPSPFDLGRELAVVTRGSSALLAVPPIGRGAAGAAELRALREERGMVADRAAAVAAIAARSAEADGEALLLLDETVVGLRRELAAQAAAHARAANRLAQGEREARSETVGTGADGLADILAELRAELGRLAAIADREAEARSLAEQRAAELERRIDELEDRLRDRDERAQHAFETIGELRALLASLAGAELEPGAADRSAEPDAAAEPVSEVEAEPEPEPGGDVELERFDAALARLRAAAGEPSSGDSVPLDGTEPPIPAAGATRPWLRAAFADLIARDPDTAGELFVALLPAQGAAWSDPIAYDLVLAPGDVVRLTSAGGGARPEIERAEAPRDLKEVAFRATGGPAELALLIAAGPFRRRFRRRGLARVDGGRRAVAAPAAILDTRLDLGQLQAAGVRLEPRLAAELADWIERAQRG
jgi:TolA-binding protein